MKRILILLTLMLMPAMAAAEPVVINAVGDIMLAGRGERTYRKLGYDYPFAATGKLLHQGNIVIGNLESPLASSGVEFTGKKFRFKADVNAAAALKNAGFTHLSLANNHMLDFGAEGLRQTVAALDANRIAHSGAGRNLHEARRGALAEVNGLRIAFLSFSLTYPEEFFAGEGRAGTAPGYVPFFSADIAAARKNADCVIVAFHWGGEGERQPKAYQVSAARRAIDAGADIIIGHHPHVLQGVEHYGKGVIFYSLGNFAFGSMSRSSDRSIIARIVFDKGIKEVEIIPLNVLNSEVRFQPQPLEGSRAEKTARSVEEISKPLGSRVTKAGGRYLVVRRED